jgi:hypothetical protein
MYTNAPEITLKDLAGRAKLNVFYRILYRMRVFKYVDTSKIEFPNGEIDVMMIMNPYHPITWIVCIGYTIRQVFTKGLHRRNDASKSLRVFKRFW